jgi:hypothetical protein
MSVRASLRGAWPRVWPVLVVVLAPGAQIAATLHALAPQLGLTSWYQAQIVALEPVSVLHQSRLLGPLLVEAIAMLAGVPHAIAWGVLVVGLLGAFYVGLVWACGGVNSRSATLTAVAALALAALCRGCWFLSWDLIDLLILGGVVLAVTRKAAPGVLIGLVFLAVFNREIALILGLWLVAVHVFRRRWQLAGLFVALTGYAAWWAWWARGLALREVGTGMGWEQVPGYPFCLPYNLSRGWELLCEWRIPEPLVAVAFAWLVGWALCQRQRREIAELGGLYLSLWVATVVIGCIQEMRLWVGFIPLLLLWVDQTREAGRWSATLSPAQAALSDYAALLRNGCASRNEIAGMLAASRRSR